MTAAAAAPVRHRTPRATSAVPLSAARLLRVELRRNTMPWILPLIAALLWFDSYRPSTGASPLYGLRTFWNMGEGRTIIDFGPFVAGVAAWMGSRDGRRGLTDLVTATARPRWDRPGDCERPGAAAAGRADRRAGPGAAGGVPRAAAEPGPVVDRDRSTHLVEDVGAACPWRGLDWRGRTRHIGC